MGKPRCSPWTVLRGFRLAALKLFSFERASKEATPMHEERESPLCQKCNKPVPEFEIGREFRRGQLCYFESRCHGETERVEYRPLSRSSALFVPAKAFPADGPPADQVGAEPKPDDEKHPMTIQDELLAMPEWKRIARIQHFSTSLRLFHANKKEVTKLLDLMTVDPRGDALGNVSNRARLDAAMEEVLRLLHNFVAAAKSLVDHSRTLYRDLYEKTGLFPDYTTEAKSRFEEESLVQFVNGLRQFAQHYRLPALSYVTNFHVERGLQKKLVLQKANLVEFSGWNAPAKKYLDAAPAQIDIREVVDAYEVAVGAFYKWMEGRLKEIHAADMAAVTAKEKERTAALAKEIPALMEGVLQIFESHGIGQLHDVFAVALSPAEQFELEAIRSDTPQWVDEALRRVEARFGALPGKLVERLRRHASGAR